MSTDHPPLPSASSAASSSPAPPPDSESMALQGVRDFLESFGASAESRQSFRCRLRYALFGQHKRNYLLDYVGFASEINLVLYASSSNPWVRSHPYFPVERILPRNKFLYKASLGTSFLQAFVTSRLPRHPTWQGEAYRSGLRLSNRSRGGVNVHAASA
jgi:hypothetical protein